MSKVLKLIKVSFQMSYSSFSSKNAKMWLFLSILGGGVIFFGLYRFFYFVVGALYGILAPIGQESFILGFIFTISTFILLLYSISNILKVFFYSEDLENLLPLPLSPHEILLAKFVVLVFPSYVLNIFMVAPVLLAYGVVASSGILYYLFSIIVFILLPIIPNILMLIIMMMVMRYTNISKNKDRTKVISGVLSLAFAIGVNILVRQQSLNIEIDGSMERWVESDALLVQITTYFPTSYLGARSLDASLSGLFYLALYLLLSILAMWILLTLGQKIYYKSIMGLNIASISKRKKRQKHHKQSSVLLSYAMKEMKIAVRTPAYLVGCVLQTFYMPIFMFVITFFDNSELYDVSGEANIGNGTVLMIMVLATNFILSFSPMSVTSISREGETWFTNRYLPIKATTIIYGKALPGWFMDILVLVLGGILLYFAMGFSVLLLILWFMIGCMSTFISNVIAVYINGKKPHIHWENEQQALRSPMNGLLSFFVKGILFGGILLVTLLVSMPVSFHMGMVFGSLFLLHLIALLLLKIFIGGTAEDVIGGIY